MPIVKNFVEAVIITALREQELSEENFDEVFDAIRHHIIDGVVSGTPLMYHILHEEVFDGHLCFEKYKVLRNALDEK
jgi:hypothetical protein